jgi:glutaredoxin 3
MPRIEIYTRPFCPYCTRAKSLLAAREASFEEHDLARAPARFEEMLARAGGRRTVPQIFIGDRHVGGSDDLVALESSGELDRLLAA